MIFAFAQLVLVLQHKQRLAISPSNIVHRFARIELQRITEIVRWFNFKQFRAHARCTFPAEVEEILSALLNLHLAFGRYVQSGDPGLEIANFLALLVDL